MRPLRLLSLLILLAASSCSQKPDELLKEHLAKGDAFMKANDRASAVVEYRSAVQAVPLSGEAHRKLGEALLANKEPVPALGEFVRAADLLPEDRALQLTAARLLQLARLFDDSKARLEKLLARDPKDVDALILLGKALLGLGDPDEAILQTQEALKLAPNESRTYVALANAEFAMGREAAALAALKKAVDVDPKSAAAHVGLGYYYWTTRELKDAEREFRAALAIQPNDVLAHRILAALYLTSNRTAEAEAELKAITAILPDPEPKLDLADYYLEANKLPEARALLEELAKDNRIALRARLRLAIVSFREGHKAEATKIIDDILARNPNNIEALVQKTRLLMLESQWDAAIDRALQAAKADPSSVLAQFLLGGAYVQKNDIDNAMLAFVEVLKLNPRVVKAQIQLSRLYLAKGDAASATRLAQEALRIEPFNEEAHLIHAEALLAKGDLKNAEAELASLAKTYAGSTAVQTQLGRLAIQQKNPAAAVKYFERALVLSPTNRNALDGLVSVHLDAKRPAEARKLLTAALERKRDDPPLLMLLADTHIAEGNNQAAEEILRRVIVADPTNLVAYGKLGRLYIVTKRLDEAKANFQKALAQKPNSVGLMTMIGLILEVQEKPDEARKQYERVMDIDPNAAVAANNLASIYLESNQNPAEALRLAQKAQSRMPGVAAVNDTLGWAYCVNGLEARALPALEAAVKQEPRNPMYQFHLGMAALKATELPKAKTALTKALELKPDFPKADEAKKALALIR